jgi:hypothetical protein
MFAVYGLQNIIAIGEPTAPLRWVCLKLAPNLAARFFRCSLCVGFWVGVKLTVWFILIPEKFWIYAMLPFAGAGVCYFFHSLNPFGNLPEIPEPETPEIMEEEHVFVDAESESTRESGEE